MIAAFNFKLGQKIRSNVRGMNPDMGFISHLVYTATQAVAEAVAGVHAAGTVDASQVTWTTGLTNPVTPRNITLTATGTAANVKAVVGKITGTNYLDEVITENLPAFTVDTLGTVVGTKAFKTVTKIEIPAMDGAVTVSAGFGKKLGLPYKLALNTVLNTHLNATREATAPTVTVSTTAIESNTIELSSALNGSIVDVFLIV